MVTAILIDTPVAYLAGEDKRPAPSASIICCEILTGDPALVLLGKFRFWRYELRRLLISCST
jgi:hypothetical protein